jgi:hypothetical protein
MRRSSLVVLVCLLPLAQVQADTRTRTRARNVLQPTVPGVTLFSQTTVTADFVATGNTTNTGSVYVDVTVPSGLVNGCLVVKWSTHFFNGTGLNGNATVWFDGTLLTRGATGGVTVGGNGFSAIYVLTSVPAPGVYVLQINQPKDPGTVPLSTINTVISVEFWNHVNQTTPVTAGNGNSGGNNTTATVDVTSASNEIVTDVVGSRQNHGLTIGANQSLRYSATKGAGGAMLKGKGSSEVGAATTTMSWSGGAGGDSEWSCAAISLQRYPGARVP